MRLKLIAILLSAAAWGQTPGVAEKAAPTEKMAFEVASVKLAEPPKPAPGGKGFMIMMGTRGGPGTNDPGRWTCSNCTLKMLLAQGYDVKQYQLTAPGWMDSERYEISAKVPEGATKAQLGLMIQNLLEERFKVAVHRETKEMGGYELVVAKGGPKMAEHVEAAPKEGADKDANDQPKSDKELADAAKSKLEGLLAGQAARSTSFNISTSGGGGGGGGHAGPDLDEKGYPKVQKGCKGCMMIINGKATMSADGETMEEFAAQLTNQVGKPVTDATGLKGKYDFALTFDPSSLGRGGPGGLGFGFGAPTPAPSSPSGSTPITGSEPDGGIPITGAIQNQLGLKLEAKKVQVQMVVVDRAEKMPTEN